MSYFGTAGPPSRVGYSIGAGYQRRSNQLKARKAAPLGNIGNIAGNSLKQLKETYSKSLGFNPFDVPQNPIRRTKYPQDKKGEYDGIDTPRADLYTYAKRYTDSYETDYKFAKKYHDQVKKEKKILDDKIDKLRNIHLELTEEDAKPNRSEFKIFALNTQARAIEPKYRWETYHLTYKEQLASKNSLDRQAEIATEDLAKKRRSINFDRDGMENWFVRGGLVKENKAAAVGWGATLLGIGVTIYIVNRLVRPAPTFKGGNKSAAMAVFG